MKNLILISFSLLSLNIFAQDYIYQGVKNVDATVGINSESEPEGETISENCYTAEVGTRGSWQGCDGLLIVDNTILENMVRNDGNYSDSNIFTGQVTDMSFLFCTNGNTTCTGKNANLSIVNWDTSNVINMNYMFRRGGSGDFFNQDIGKWDVLLSI